MKASIVLPNLNGGHWLKDSIESLYAQTETDFELIVIDNGSTDGSLDVARAYNDRGNYTLIENGRNTGFSFAVNQGIRMAKSPFVLLFNNDAFAAPNMLQEMLQEMNKSEKTFAVQCLMLRHYEQHKADDAGDYVNLLGWACKRGDGLPAKRYQRAMRIFCACGGASLYRKSILDEIGLFDELFFAYLEDVDIGWRANNAGYQSRFCPAATCTHICGAATGGATGAKYNNFKAVQSGRNNLLLPYKNLPLPFLVLNFPWLLLGYGIKTLFFHIRGYGKPWRQGLREGLALLGKVEKTAFSVRRMPQYLWVQWQLIVNMFVYADYRIRRIFVK